MTNSDFSNVINKYFPFEENIQVLQDNHKKAIPVTGRGGP
jgi:hypothetical protein